MANKEMLQIEKDLKELLDEALSWNRELGEGYEQMLAHAQTQWEEADTEQQKNAEAVHTGFATEIQVAEYLLEAERKRKMQKLFRDRQESLALAEMPLAEPLPNKIAVFDNNDKIE